MSSYVPPRTSHRQQAHGKLRPYNRRTGLGAFESTLQKYYVLYNHENPRDYGANTVELAKNGPTPNKMAEYQNFPFENDIISNYLQDGDQRGCITKAFSWFQ